jgi:hypothetical protein
MIQVPKIEKKARVLKTEISLDFTDTDGIEHKANIKRDELDPNYWEVYVDGVLLPKDNIRPLEEFVFCEQDENGDVTIGKKKYFCHVLKTASEGTFLLGNHSCPYVLNPPGIMINL